MLNEGLRIDFITRSLLNAQLFYILAENGDIKIFKD